MLSHVLSSWGERERVEGHRKEGQTRRGKWKRGAATRDDVILQSGALRTGNCFQRVDVHRTQLNPNWAAIWAAKP
jgi:hypothetical protein